MAILQQPPKAGVIQLLSAANLPTKDITEPLLRNFWVYVAQDKMIGVVGLELLDGVALLRSLAVDSAHRNRGMGTELARYAEQMAAEQNVRELYLLTNSAQEFFESRGYKRISRQSAPPEVRGTREFSELCPASSLLMKKSLR
jgi:amino-acid N-acetyltransferase